MTTLITGGAGYIGSHVVLAFLAAGESVIVVDNLSRTGASVAPPGAAFFRGDCSDPQLMGRLIDDADVTTIVHLAGSAVVPDSVADPAACYRHNTTLRSLIEIAANHGVAHFILCSTAAAYGNGGAGALSEEVSPAPISPYGMSMLMGEMMLRDPTLAKDLSYVILRAFNAAGIDPSHGNGVADAHPSTLVRQTIDVALGVSPAVDVYGTQLGTPDGTGIRDYVHVSDLAQAHVAALAYLRAGGASATFNCGSGQGHSVLEVIRAVEAICGSPLPVRYRERRPGDPAALVADNHRIRADLQWTPRFAGIDTIIGPALTAAYRRAERRESARPFVRLVAESGVPADALQRLISGFRARPNGRTARSSDDPSFSPVDVATEAPPVPRPITKKLTIGMAVYDDYDGVYFTLQSIRLYHPEILPETEFLIIDNNPTGACGPALKAIAESIPACRYIPRGEVRGTRIRDWVFREAQGRYVLCIDCHILIARGALKRLMDYFEADPESNDLVQGPLIYDDLKGYATHFRPEWRGGMYGIWDTDPAGADADMPPFDIPMQGMGLSACRRDAWPGYNSAFRGFGGEEGYIHEKFRQRGGRVLCLPFLRWMHRFNRPFGVPYPNVWTDRVRNYLIGFQEIGWDSGPVIEHFRSLLSEQVWTAVVQALEPGLLPADAAPVAERNAAKQ